MKEGDTLSNKPRVFIPQEPMRFDHASQQMVSIMNFSKALEYGEPIVCLPSGPVALSPTPTMFKLRDCLRDFCDDDYLIAVGDPTVIAIASMIAADNNRGRVKLLKYDRDQRGYIKVEINIHHKLGQKED